MLKKIVLLIIVVINLAGAQTRLEVYGPRRCNGSVPYSSLLLTDPITRFTARDLVKIIPVPAGSGVSGFPSVIKACEGKSVVIKADPTIISNFNNNEFFSTDNFIDEPSGDYQINVSNEVGYIPGSGSVSPSGAAIYQIPIDLPEAQLGSKPSISIVYNSQSGNGLLGKGWDLSGISTISRTTSDFFHEGKFDKINLDANDNLILDGNRLLLNETTQIYYTETNTFKQIAPGFVTRPSDPDPFKADYFNVLDSYGNKYKYGYDRNSTVSANEIPVAWKINSYTDANNNKILYHYENYNGENYLQKITYGHNNDNAGIYEVIFKYSELINKETHYITNGANIKRNLILKGIVITCKQLFLKEYTFDYKTDNFVNQLVKVSLQINGSKVNETNVNWNVKAANTITEMDFSSVFCPNCNNGGQKPAKNVKEIHLGDFDGDGTRDILLRRGDTRISGIYDIDKIVGIGVDYQDDLQILFGKKEYNFNLYQLKTVHQNGAAYVVGPNGGNPNNVYFGLNRLWVHDLNGDGKSEVYYNHLEQKLFVANQYTIHSYKTEYNGNSLVGKGLYANQYDWVSNDDVQSTNLNFGDFNGDGKTDLFCARPYNSLNPANTTLLNTDPSSTNIPDWANANNAFCLGKTYTNGHLINTVIDADRNGVDEIYSLNIVKQGDSYRNGCSDLISLDQNNIVTPAYLHQAMSIFPNYGDFNGDGKPDVLIYRNATTDPGNANLAYPKIYINSGNGDFIENTFLSSAAESFLKSPIPSNFLSINKADLNALKIYPADFNGDGKTDLLSIVKEDDKWKFKIGYSKEKTFEVETNEVGIGDFEKSNIAIDDFNDDGNADILIIDKEGTAKVWFVNKGTAGSKYLMSAVTDGFGNKFEYAYIAPVEGNGTYSFPSDISYSFPLQKYVPGSIVSSSKVPDGIGGNTTTNYYYEGGLVHKQGLGFLGFQKIKRTNSIGIEETQFAYHTTKYIPYPSSAAQSSVLSSVVSETVNTFSLGTHADWPGAYFPYFSDVRNINKLTGATVKTHNVYDFQFGELLETKVSYGNATNSEAAGYVSEINTYSKINPASKIRRLKSKTTVKHSATSKLADISNIINYDSFDNYGNPTQVITNKNNQEKKIINNLTYDIFGNTLTSEYKVKNRENLTTTNIYNSDGRFLVSSKFNNEPASSYMYDEFRSRLITSIDASGLSTNYKSYDNTGRLLVMQDAFGIESTYQYTWEDVEDSKKLYKIYSQTSGISESTSYYDVLGRGTLLQDKGWNNKVLHNSITYNGIGLKSDTYNTHYSNETADTYKTNYTYTTDGTFRPKVITYPQNLKHTYTYNDNSLSTKLQLPGINRKIENQVNEEGILVKTTDLGGAIVENTVINANGEPEEIAVNATTVKYEYDPYTGRLTKLTDPAKGTETFEYNGAGDLTKASDAKDNVFDYIYDSKGRLKTRTSSTGEILTCTYYTEGLALDQPKEISFTNIGAYPQSISYGYDGKGRQNTVTQNIETDFSTNKISLTTKVDYSSTTGLAEKKTYPSGLELTYEYDHGILIKITAKGYTAPIWELTDIAADGRIKGYKYGNGNQVALSYNEPLAYPTSLKATIAGTDYNYDTDFNINTGNLNYRSNFYTSAATKITESFLYDVHDRLTDIIYNGTKKIDYTANGNIEGKFDAAAKGVMQYGTLGANVYALSQIDIPLNVDLNVKQEITYNHFNKASTVKLDGKGTLTIVYGPDDQRIAMKNDADNYFKVYGDNYEAEVSLNGTITKEYTYIYSPSGLAAVLINTGGSKKLYYVYTDHLGSPMMLIDETGNKEFYSFDAWGRRRSPADWTYYADHAPYGVLGSRGFTMHEHLDRHGLINMNGRMYDPVVGRMLSPDPVIGDKENSQNYNRYTYAFNNPLKYTDPDGRNPVIIAAFLVGGTLNLIDNWNKINSFDVGLAYFATGGVAGAVSFVNPALAATILITGNTTLDVVNGYGPDLGNIESTVNYGTGKIIEGIGVMSTGSIAKGLVKAGKSALKTGSASIGGKTTVNKQLAVEGGKIVEGTGITSGVTIVDDIVAVADDAAKGGTSVLGHYPEYTKLASELGAKRFNIPTKIWNKMTSAEQWGANQKFLDRMILRGDNIRLATPLNQVKPGSFYQQELNYLFGNGYKVSSNGLWLVK